MHIGILILILTFLGVASQQQIAVANQEIVLQFSDIEITSQEVQNTVASVKSQLQDLGIDNIIINEGEAGKLKITYYSDVDIASVKEILYKGKKVTIDYAFNKQEGHKGPLKDAVINYNIDVYEIQNTNDIDLGFDGFVLEKQSEYDRYCEPNVFVPSPVIAINRDDIIVKVSYKVWRHIETSMDNHPYSFPEVRAGPQARGNS